MITTEIINIFVDFLDDFLLQIINSSIDDMGLKSSAHLGIQTIIHVLEYSLYQTKSLEKSYIYIKTGETYFLEYLAQMTSSGYIEDLNLNEIVLFVYKKTIFNLKDGENDENILNNMMTLSDTYIVFDDEEFNKVFADIRKCVNTLFYWKNNKITNAQRQELNNKYFQIIMNFDNRWDIFKILEYIQNICEYDYNEYKVIVKEIIDINKKNKMKEMTNDFVIETFYCEKERLIENKKKMSLKQFIKWLII